MEEALVKADPDGELDEHRPQAPQGVHAVLLVHAHGLLGEALPVLGVFGLKLLELGLEPGHGLELAALLHRQRDHYRAHDQGEDDDAEPKAVEEDAIQQHQAVDHGLDNDQVPDVADYFHWLDATPNFRKIPFIPSDSRPCQGPTLTSPPAC